MLVQQAGDLRQRLQAERASLAEQIVAIDAALSRLPREGANTTASANPLPPHPIPPKAFDTTTIPGLVLSVIGSSPGLTSKEVIASVQKKRPKLQPRDVFANLYRLHHKRGLIRTEGPKGSTRYFLAVLGAHGASR